MKEMKEEERLKMRQKKDEERLKIRHEKDKKILTAVFGVLSVIVIMFIGISVCKSFNTNASETSAAPIFTGDRDAKKSFNSQRDESEKLKRNSAKTEEVSQVVAQPDPREDVWNHYKNLAVVKGDVNYLNIRDMPTTDGMIVGKLAKYSGVDILEDAGDGWYHIRSGEVDGYVSGEFVAAGEEGKQLALEHCFQMLEVTMEYVNVQREPSVDSETWAQLRQNERYIIKQKVGEWYRLDFNSENAYVPVDSGEVGYYLPEAESWSTLENCSEPRRQLIEFGMQYLGVPYVWGGTNFSTGVDCSGFTLLCFRHIGIQLPRVSYHQVNVGIPVSLEEAKPGDLLFYADANGTIDHVAIYIGDGKILQSANSLHQVTISRYNYNTEPVAIRNVIGD